MVLFKQYKDLKILLFLKKNQKTMVFRIGVPFQVNQFCTVPVKTVISPVEVQEP